MRRDVIKLLSRGLSASAPVARWLGRPRVQAALYLLSVAAVLAPFALYGAQWLGFNWPMLTDPDLQSDDARTSIFPLHRYDSVPALVDDPIADEMLNVVPIGVHALYRILVPLTGIFMATKWVQGLAFGIVVVAGVILARARRTGLGAAVLLIFFVLHDWFAVERIAGGLPRAFGFPCFALWLSGVLAQNRWARYSAPVILALTYPSVMNMVLAAEGLLAVRGLARVKPSVVLHRLRRYAIVVAICFVGVLPSLVGDSERGPIHTLEQAKREPAFGKRGRLWLLPFDEPSKVFLKAYIDQLTGHGGSPTPDLYDAYRENAEPWAVTVFAALLVLVVLGFAPFPTAALVFTCGTVILYLLSRVLAFQLYSPERYYSFGLRMAAIALLVAAPAGLCFRLRPRPREILRNACAAGLLLLVWCATGTGQKAPSGMFIDAKRDRPLYDFIRTLDKDVRFATHPLDGDNIPFYSARATMGSFETLQPWFVDSWRRQKQRAEDTLSALYSDDRQAVLDYAKKNGVTHFLLNTQRYRRNFTRQAGSFEPLSSYARRLLSGKRLEDLVFYRVPEKAVVYEYKKWRVVDVKRLEQVWSHR